MDFQSTALPTELQNHLGRPNLAKMCSLSRCKEDITNVFSFFLHFLLDLVVDELNWAVSARQRVEWFLYFIGGYCALL